MDAHRFHRIQELFQATADLPEPAQDEFLAKECAGDPELLKEVQAMLEEDARGESMLEQGPARAAEQVLGNIPAALAGQQFGPYRLERVLGEGGMGAVYLGRRDDLGSTAAIKILRDAWFSPARRERFLSEQKTLAQLQHPAIARLYDADTLPDGTPWFAMEYVEGEPLTEFCAKRSSSVDERLRLFRKVCEAVQHAHLHAVIHRDLKPSNILATADGEVKLLDFGIAKQMSDADTASAQTLTSLRMMTPAYAAPEQIRGGRVGIYTDVYSLGVVLYELLAGKLPYDFSERSAGEAERMILEDAPPKPSSQRGERGSASSWADLDVLCLTAMHKDPERRYRSVEALVRDLDHFLRQEPLEARADSFGYRLGKFVRRNHRAVAAAAVVATLVGGLVVFYTLRLTTARNEALAQSARTERIMRFMINLFEGGDQEAGPANDLKVVTLIDRGVEQARSLVQDREAQAELYRTLGDVSQKLGNLDRAETLLREALEQRRTIYGADHASVAESMVDLALLRTDQAKHEEAEKLAREALAMTRRTHPVGHPAIATALEALGKVLEERGTYDEGVRVLEEAVRLRSAPGGAPADLAGSMLELANVHFYAGHYKEAEELNQRVLAMHRQIYGPRHPLVAEDLINLGAIQQDTGHYVDAERFHRQALEITEAFYGHDHPKTASNLTLIGRALEFQNRFDEAVELLNRSLVVRERVYGPTHPQLASTLNELGNIALQQKKFDEAEAKHRRTLEIYKKAYNGKHYLVGIGMANLATVFMNRKDYTQAEPLFREALAMFAQTLPAGHLNSGISKIKLGRTLLRQNRFTEAEAATREGYDIVSKQASPAVSWLQNARQDLIEVYGALHKPELVQKFQQEREAAAKK